jgi:hypothetical protein
MRVELSNAANMLQRIGEAGGAGQKLQLGLVKPQREREGGWKDIWRTM